MDVYVAVNPARGNWGTEVHASGHYKDGYPSDELASVAEALVHECIEAEARRAMRVGGAGNVFGSVGGLCGRRFVGLRWAVCGRRLI